MKKILPTIFLLFFLAFPSFSQSEENDIFTDNEMEIVNPDAHGTFRLNVEKSAYSGFNLEKKNDLVYTTRNWDSKDALARWKVNIPEDAEYIVYIQWAKEKQLNHTLDFSVNGSSVLQWAIEHTGSRIREPHWSRRSKEIGKIKLLKGVSEVQITVPNAEKEEECIDLSGFWLVPASGHEEKVQSIRSGPRLGISSYELELLYGPGMLRQDINSIARNGGQGNEDWLLYKSIVPKTNGLCWSINNMKLAAFFYQDKCICLEFDIAGDDTRDTALIVAKSMVRDTEFDTKNIPDKGDFTIYSKDKRYKFQYWGGYFEIKDSSLVKKLKEKEEQELKSFEGMPRIGMKIGDLQRLWGPGRSAGNHFFININEKKNNPDWELIESISPYLQSYRWSTVWQKRQLSILARLWKDRCIGIDVSIEGSKDEADITGAIAQAITNYLLPGVQFEVFKGNAGSEFVEYSKKPTRAYQVYKWSQRYRYVEIFGLGLIRSLIAQELPKQKKDAVTLTNAISALPKTKIESLFGAKKSEIESLLGPPIQSSLKIPGNTAVYGLPECDMKLLVHFAENLLDNSICKEISIFYDGGVLSAESALPVAQALMGKVSIPSMTASQKKRWFLVYSTDKESRFSLRWYLDNKLGVILKIKDNKTIQKAPTEKLKGVLEVL